MSIIGVNTFVSNINKGLASPNKYMVSFNAPSVINDTSISMMCNVSALPGRGFQTIENRHYNTPFKLPYTQAYADVTFSFVNTIGMEERSFFDKWHTQIIEPEHGLIGFYDDYRGIVKIEHLEGRSADVDYSVSLYNAYPIDLGEIMMGYSMVNETLISTITFAYQYWEED